MSKRWDKTDLAKQLITTVDHIEDRIQVAGNLEGVWPIVKPIKAIADAVDGKAVADEMTPYVPVASPCDTKTYEAGGWKACFELQGLIP